MATIRKRGAKWQVQVRRVGFQSLSRSFHIRKDAEAWARQMEVQADRSELPTDRKALQRVTLGELVERYRDTVIVKKRGYVVERAVLTAFLRHPICRKRLSEIGAEDFASYRDERLKTVKASTLKRQLSPLHNMFEVTGDEWGLALRRNPLSKLRLHMPQQRRERRLKDGELDKLRAAARSCRNGLILPIILFALATAMRRSEILALQWHHIDREGSSLLIPHGKNGYSRKIPLTQGMLEILDGLPMKGDRVFSINANAFRLAWDRVRARAAITDLHFHDLRHEAISRFFENGLNVPEVALISGHRDARMLFRYTHPRPHTIAEKLKAFDHGQLEFDRTSEKGKARDTWGVVDWAKLQ
jgi:integrase